LKKISLKTTLALALISAGLAAVPAQAVEVTFPGATPILPAPFYNLSLSLGGLNTETFTAPGTYQFGGVAIKATGSPGATTLSGSTAGVNDLAHGTILYHYVVCGGLGCPADDVLVPLFVTFTLHASGSGDSRISTDVATAELDVGGATLSIRKAIQDSNLPGAGQTSDFTGTLPFNQFNGQVGAVTLNISGVSNGGGSTSAFVDPFLFIDPAFLLTHPGYSVIVSEGIGNVAPAAPGVPGVPEPVTLALFASGLLGFIARRRRRI
jgi:hypothetical protein